MDEWMDGWMGFVVVLACAGCSWAQQSVVIAFPLMADPSLPAGRCDDDDAERVDAERPRTEQPLVAVEFLGSRSVVMGGKVQGDGPRLLEAAVWRAGFELRVARGEAGQAGQRRQQRPFSASAEQLTRGRGGLHAPRVHGPKHGDRAAVGPLEVDVAAQ